MPTFLLTGATGFIGSHLHNSLIAEGINARCLPSVDQAGVKAWHSQELAATDIEGANIVVHLAGIAHRHDLDVQGYFDINRDATLRLATAALDAGVTRFVFVSTVKASAYDKNLEFNDERVSLVPIDAYGRSKREAETSLRSLFDNTSTELVIVRPALVYGVGVKGSLSTLLRLARRGYLPDIRCSQGAGLAVRSMVAVEDLVQAIRLLADAKGVANETFIVADSEPYTMSRLVRSVYAALGSEQAPFTLNCRTLARLATCFQTLAPVLPTKLAGAGDMLAKVCQAERYSAAKLSKATAWRPEQRFETVLPAMLKP